MGRLRSFGAICEEKDQMDIDSKRKMWEKLVRYQPKTEQKCLETFGMELMSQLRRSDKDEVESGMRLELFKCTIEQLKLKIPEEYMRYPNFWGLFALLNLFDGETLNEVRTAYKNYKEVYMSTECLVSTKLLSRPRDITNKIHDLICERVTKTGAYKVWDREPYETSAKKITAAFCAEKLVNFEEAGIQEKYKRKWGLFPEGCPDITRLYAESIPPHMEVPVKYLYMPENIGKMIISVDLKKSGFEIMRIYNEAVMCGARTWKDLISIVIKSDPEIRDLESVGLDKFRGIRMRSLGKFNHEKSRAMQSHALRILVRAMVYYCEKHPAVNIGSIESVFKFSCDELIVVCSSANDSSVWREAIMIVDGAMSVVPTFKSISRIELIHLRALDYSPKMLERWEKFKREQGGKGAAGSHKKLDSKYKSVVAEEDKTWIEPNVSRETFDMIFIREKYWGSDDDPKREYKLMEHHTYALKALPSPIYVDGALEVVKQLYPEWYADH